MCIRDSINTYAGPPPRTSGRRRKPSVLVHQVSVDEDDGGLYVQPAPRPVYQGGVRLSALRVKQLVDSDRTTLDRDEICEAMDVDGKVSQTDYGRCGGMLSGRLGPNKFIVDYAKGLRSKCKRHRCKHAFRDGELRVGKIPPRARKDVPARRVHWYHPACIFKSFERASKKTKTIDTVDDMEGFSELKEADKADLTSRVAAWVARKAAMNANYKPKKRKRRGGDWLPSPTASFDNEATASFDADGDEDDEPEEADEEAVDLLVGLTQQRPVVERSQHDEGAAELLAALAGSPPPPAAAAPSSTVSETFAVGDVVEANYRGQGHWYPGRIASFDSGSYEIAYDDGESESGVSTANVRRASSAEDDDAATAPAEQPAKEDDDRALPLPMHELFAAVAAAYASSDAAKATTLYEKAAAIALKCGSASAGFYLSKAAQLE